MTFMQATGVQHPNAVNSQIAVLIIRDKSTFLNRSDVIIPHPQRHPRRIYAALIEMGLDKWEPNYDILGLAYWLAGMDSEYDRMYHDSHTALQSRFALTFTFTAYRILYPGR